MTTSHPCANFTCLLQFLLEHPPRFSVCQLLPRTFRGNRRKSLPLRIDILIRSSVLFAASTDQLALAWQYPHQRQFSRPIPEPRSSASHHLALLSLLTLPRFLSSPIITVRVGTENAKEFYIHKDRLCRNSPFFKSALEKDWSESRSNIVSLPDDEVETFAVYCDWLYNTSPFTESISTGTKDVKAIWFVYRRAYMFGDKVLDRDFCDMILDETMKTAKKLGVTPTGLLFFIFNLAYEGVPARQLLLDVMLYSADSKWLNNPYWNDVNNFEAMKEISKTFIRSKESPIEASKAPYTSHKTMCRYHWHTMTGSACFRTKRGCGWLREGTQS